MRHYIQSRIKSFQYAFEGLKPVLKGQKNMHIHILAAFVVIGAGVYFDITSKVIRKDIGIIMANLNLYYILRRYLCIYVKKGLLHN